MTSVQHNPMHIKMRDFCKLPEDQRQTIDGTPMVLTYRNGQRTFVPVAIRM